MKEDYFFAKHKRYLEKYLLKKLTRGFLLMSLDRASFLNKLEETMGVVWKEPHGDLSDTLCGRAKASIPRLVSALP